LRNWRRMLAITPLVLLFPFPAAAAPASAAMEPLQITYYGRACFVVEGSSGIRLMIDPFNEKLGYPVPNVPVDAAVVTHGHGDHNAVEVLPGAPAVFRSPGTFKNVRITGREFNHDDQGGKLRGKTWVYLIEIDGWRIVHMGDIGEVPPPEALDIFRGADVLMIPVGGYYTVEPEQAVKLARMLAPGYIIPMHYRITGKEVGVVGVDKFLSGWDGPVERRASQVTLTSRPAASTVLQMKAAFEE